MALYCRSFQPSHRAYRMGNAKVWMTRIGNKVPHPFLLFIWLIVVLMVATAVLSALGVSVRSPADGSMAVQPFNAQQVLYAYHAAIGRAAHAHP